MVKNQSVKYSRGTVWWYNDEELFKFKGVQSGKRPVLVISSNNRGPCQSVEVIKFTLTDKSETCPSINIPITYNGRTSYALCNQHFTINTKSLGDYMYTVPEDIMNKVDRGLLIAQGMEDLVEIKDLLDSIDKKDIIIKMINKLNNKGSRTKSQTKSIKEEEQ